MTLTARGLAARAVVLGGVVLAVPATAHAAEPRPPEDVPAAAQVVPPAPTQRTPSGSDPALLIGVGVAALAGAGGLFAAAQYTARRA